jgi:hypothetical protein
MSTSFDPEPAVLVLDCLARSYLIAVAGLGLVGAGLAFRLIFSAAARSRLWQSDRFGGVCWLLRT